MESGLICRHKSRKTGSTYAVYIAAEQGIDVGDAKYAVVCETHAAILGSYVQQDAIWCGANSDEFCDECRT